MLCSLSVSYSLGFLMTKNPWLVFRLKHEIPKQNFFDYSIMEKMLIIQFHCMKKMLVIQFHLRKNVYLAIHIFLLYEIV